MPMTTSPSRRTTVPKLALLPTPLVEAPRLSEELGVHLLIKRDDQTGLALGGNKARKLDYLVFCNGISPEYGLGGLPPFTGTDWPWLSRLTTPDDPVQIYAIHPPASGDIPL